MNDDVNSRDLPSIPGSIDAEVPEASPDSSFIHKLFPKFSVSMPRSSILIAAGMGIGILLIGGGGTYVVASSMFQPKTQTQISDIPSSDIPSFNEKVSLTIPTLSPTPVVYLPTPTPELVNPSGSASPGVTANWSPYNFSPVFLNFSYPPGWFVNVAATSGAPYLFVQNYPSTTTPVASSSGNFSIYIGRLEQIGITTVAQLTTQLALNAANNTYLGTVNMGTTTVISSTPITINGYSALQRTITYSAFPAVQYFEVYILDGVTNAIRFAPQLDISGTMPYFNQLLGTVDFTN